MRAGRLVSVILILERRGRVTAAELAAELEVSQRTILRDLDALSGAGLPVYATRGRSGGFQLLNGYSSELTGPASWRLPSDRAGRTIRVTVRISPQGRRVAAVLGRLQPLRVRRAVPADGRGWLEATVGLHSFEWAVADVLSLGPEVEVLEPEDLRRAVADRAARTARLHGADAEPTGGSASGPTEP